MATIHLCGELDLASAPEFGSSLPPLPCEVFDVVVDLTRLEFCDVAGMRAMHRFCAEQTAAGRRVQVSGARPYFRKVARITGLVPQCLED